MNHILRQFDLAVYFGRSLHFLRITFMWRGGQDQKKRQANPMSNTKDENEPSDAEGVTLPRIIRLFGWFAAFLQRLRQQFKPPSSWVFRAQPRFLDLC